MLLRRLLGFIPQAAWEDAHGGVGAAGTPTMAAQPETTISGAYVGIQALLLCCWAENVSYSLMCWYTAEDGRFCTQLIAVCKSATVYLWRGTKKRRETKAKEKALRVCKELQACSANTSTSPQQPQRRCWCSYPCDHGHYSPVCCLPCQVSKVVVEWFQRLRGFKGDPRLHAFTSLPHQLPCWPALGPRLSPGSWDPDLAVLWFWMKGVSSLSYSSIPSKSFCWVFLQGRNNCGILFR